MTSGRQELADASKRAEASLSCARGLLTAGFPSASLVWAVRSVEIFYKEFVLADLFMQGESQMTWDRAVRKASNLFESLKWDKAIRRIDKEFGPLDPMVTKDGKDLLLVWQREIVPDRHNIAHGRKEASPAHAAFALELGEQLILQVKLRLIVEGKHSFSETFKEIYEELFEAYHGRPQPKGEDLPRQT